ncbi:hypothetical protein AD947_11645 [Acetobacter tropicalis]|uniref:Uncharacterized protein n=1 Tax=Acetobacter tropicalis TaxID=104102 RepID=A0A149TSM7_9PROT|nr:hypothetical protein AD947_11645 [Acetobacter tropicalis]
MLLRRALSGVASWREWLFFPNLSETTRGLAVISPEGLAGGKMGMLVAGCMFGRLRVFRSRTGELDFMVVMKS